MGSFAGELVLGCAPMETIEVTKLAAAMSEAERKHLRQQPNPKANAETERVVLSLPGDDTEYCPRGEMEFRNRNEAQKPEQVKTPETDCEASPAQAKLRRK